MTQTSWLSDLSTRFAFYTNADAALISYLQTSAPNGLATLLASVSITRTVLTELNLDDSKSGFPKIHLWTEAAEDQYLTPSSPMVTNQSRFIVWYQDADTDVMMQMVQQYCGAIASALEQTISTSGNDWADFYFCWREGNEPHISISNLAMDGALARGEVRCIWTHYE